MRSTSFLVAVLACRCVAYCLQGGNVSDFVTNHKLQEYLRELIESGKERGLRIEKIDRNLESIDRWRVRMDTRIDKHDHTLFGNGEPGWDEVLRNVNMWIAEQKRKEETNWSDTKKFILGALAFVLNSLLMIAITRMFG